MAGKFNIKTLTHMKVIGKLTSQLIYDPDTEKLLKFESEAIFWLIRVFVAFYVISFESAYFMCITIW